MTIDGAPHRPACARGVRHLARSGRSYCGRRRGGRVVTLSGDGQLGVQQKDFLSNAKVRKRHRFPEFATQSLRQGVLGLNAFGSALVGSVLPPS